MFRKSNVAFLLSGFIVLFFGFLLFDSLKKTALAFPEEIEWKTKDFTIEIRSWDNPIGTEGIDNSGINKSKCMYKIESFNPGTNLWELTHNPENRGCWDPIIVTVGAKTGEGWKEGVEVKVETADCKYSGENACKITAWSKDNAGNSNLGTDKMAVKYFNIQLDTTPPTTKIKLIRKSTGEDLTNKWARADIYKIQFEDADNIGGSDLKSCEYYINSCNPDGRNCSTTVVPLRTRPCKELVEITAGKTASTYNLEGYSYLVYSRVEDNARNSSLWVYQYLWFDFTPPTAEIK